MTTISPTLYDTILNEWKVPGLTAGRLDYLERHAPTQDALIAWLTPSSGDPVLVALRAAHAAQGRHLHERDRTVTALAVPTGAITVAPTANGDLASTDPGRVWVVEHAPALWRHHKDDKVGTVTRSRLTGWGLRVWLDIARGARGDDLLLATGYGELGVSIGFDADHADLVHVGGTAGHLTVNGQVREVSLVPIETAGFGTETRAERASAPPANAPAVGAVAARAVPVLRDREGRALHIRAYGQRLTVR